ncbi:HAMP domain-containing sensor histidine kinase [Silvibacterium acidisoli]|uniref:HAMP domain-containing sensor histidine kinase n=1 Tax=Acidobacteriaceae bacterium ZG23-2 TaxID=2883246 RepID=UPI00406D1A2B
MKSNLNARLNRLKAKVPVHRFFFKIFVWFWATVLGMFLLFWLSYMFSGLKEVSTPNMYATVAPVLAAEVVHSYESAGPKEFARFTRSNIDDRDRKLYLLDGNYKDVLGRPIEDEGLYTARAAKLNRLIVYRDHIAAFKVVSPTGRPYILLLYIRSDLGELGSFLVGQGFPYAAGMVLFVSLFSLLLAYHIASPVHNIQSAARSVATGNLKARVDPAVSRRHDELASLAVDFDSMVDRLEALIRSQKELLSSVSHEVRSPLARINLSLAILRREYAGRSEDVLDRLESDVERVDLLMTQLLTLSRLEAGLSSAERENVHIREVLEEVTADCNFEAQAFDKAVTLSAMDEIYISNADAYALRSAFENITRNAVRFTAPGTRVEVALKVEERAEKLFAMVSIRDHGPGIPNESLETIFHPFVQLASNDPSGESHNGLGLAIASEAIRMHQGQIRALNLPSGGLEVSVSLPVVDRFSPHIHV